MIGFNDCKWFFKLTNKLYLLTGHNADDIAETVIMNGKLRNTKVHVQCKWSHIYIESQAWIRKEFLYTFVLIFFYSCRVLSCVYLKYFLQRRKAQLVTWKAKNGFNVLEFEYTITSVWIEWQLPFKISCDDKMNFFISTSWRHRKITEMHSHHHGNQINFIYYRNVHQNCLM